MCKVCGSMGLFVILVGLGVKSANLALLGLGFMFDWVVEYSLLTVVLVIAGCYGTLSKVICVVYICLEIQSLAVMVMVLSHSWRCVGNGSLNYVQFYCLAGFLFLFGMVLTYGLVGSFVVEYVVEVIWALAGGDVSNYLCMSWTSSLIGLFVKVYSLPGNYGVLNIYESVPLYVLFLLVVVTQFYVVVVLSGPLGGLCYKLTLSFLLCGVSSLVVGFIGGIVETGIARCLGYSSVGNTGFLLLGLGCGSEIFNSYVILWSLCYSIGLFLFGVVYGFTVGYVPPKLAVCSLVRLDELCGLAYSDTPCRYRPQPLFRWWLILNDLLLYGAVKRDMSRNYLTMYRSVGVEAPLKVGLDIELAKLSIRRMGH